VTNQIIDVDVDAEELRAEAYASMPASYIANYIYHSNTDFYYQPLLPVP